MADKILVGCRVWPAEHERILSVVKVSGHEQVAPWLRGLVEAEVARVEAGELAEGEDDSAPIDVQLAAARERIASLEGLVAAHKNTLTESQSHVLTLKAENDNLHRHLSDSSANIERITLMLPAAREGTETGRRRWKWWWTPDSPAG